MSQFRKTWTRIGGGAVAVAAATALIAPGVAAADDNDSGSSGSGSLELFADFLPGDTLKAFKILTAPDFSFDAVSDCVLEKFGMDNPGNDVFKIILDCVIDTDEEDAGKTPQKDDTITGDQPQGDDQNLGDDE